MATIEIPGYEIHERLGRGGMATVYRALHLNLEREVALKVIDTNAIADQSFSERFIREARISARLSHPHILQIYDVNLHGSLNYISMELLKGGDLEDFIRGAMTQREIYRVMAQMTAALDYAAEKGYVHRDIKPSNIMLRSAEDYVLADFGIAKAANSSTQMTQAGLLVGTPSYMSPEQAAGSPLDGRSDLYSLAVLCYEMLTKQVPFEADSAVSTAVKHLTEDIPRLPEHLASYQPFLDTALAKKPEERFQSGREMYQAFCEIRALFDEDAVLTAPAERPVEEAGRPSQEHEQDRTIALIANTGEVLKPERAAHSSGYNLQARPGSDNLLSGIRNERRPDSGPSKSGPGIGAIAAIVAIGVIAGGGLLFWQQQGKVTAPAHAPLVSESQEPVETDTPDSFASQADIAGPADTGGTSGIDSQIETTRPRPTEQAVAVTAGGEAKPSGSSSAREHTETRQKSDADELASANTASDILRLMDQGDALASQGKVAEAARVYLSALELDPAEAQLENRLASSADAALERARLAAGEHDFESAREALELALLLRKNHDPTSELMQALPAMERAHKHRELLSEASKAQRAGHLSDAAELYRTVLDTNPESAAARAGLDTTADAMREIIAKDIDQARFVRARERLASARQWQPENSANESLQQQLDSAEATWKTEQAMIAERQARAQSLASDTLRAISGGELDKARGHYLELQREFSELPLSGDIHERLLAAHAEATREEIGLRAYDSALALIAKGRELAPEAAVWNALDEELEQARSSERRRLGAY